MRNEMSLCMGADSRELRMELGRKMCRLEAMRSRKLKCQGRG
jgi:hypothetical protein